MLNNHYTLLLRLQTALPLAPQFPRQIRRKKLLALLLDIQFRLSAHLAARRHPAIMVQKIRQRHLVILGQVGQGPDLGKILRVVFFSDKFEQVFVCFVLARHFCVLLEVFEVFVEVFAVGDEGVELVLVFFCLDEFAVGVLPKLHKNSQSLRQIAYAALLQMLKMIILTHIKLAQIVFFL